MIQFVRIVFLVAIQHHQHVGNAVSITILAEVTCCAGSLHGLVHSIRTVAFRDRGRPERPADCWIPTELLGRRTTHSYQNPKMSEPFGPNFGSGKDDLTAPP